MVDETRDMKPLIDVSNMLISDTVMPQACPIWLIKPAAGSLSAAIIGPGVA
jgi:hypothetical protein